MSAALRTPFQVGPIYIKFQEYDFEMTEPSPVAGKHHASPLTNAHLVNKDLGSSESQQSALNELTMIKSFYWKLLR